jgi:NAD+ synthase (glutamine-hydrolysing)
MRLVRLALASVNATVGAVRSNTDRCIELAHAMAEDDVTLAVFPEQVIGGYAMEDLVQWRAYVASQRRELERFAEATRDTAPCSSSASPWASAAISSTARRWCSGDLGFVPKEKLPTYNIFYEARTFSRGRPLMSFDAGRCAPRRSRLRARFRDVALEVCEDIWSPDGPMRRRCYSGAEII